MDGLETIWNAITGKVFLHQIRYISSTKTMLNNTEKADFTMLSGHSITN